jgi:hypothetical protein
MRSRLLFRGTSLDVEILIEIEYCQRRARGTDRTPRLLPLRYAARLNFTPEEHVKDLPVDVGFFCR